MKIKKIPKKILVVFFILIFFNFVKSLSIIEINYNPINQTYADEYIELYSETPINLSEFTFCDLQDCDGLILYKEENSSYYLITTNQSSYKDCNCSIYFVDDSRLGNGLNNDGDCIFLSSSINLSFCYNESINQGLSLQFINGTWKKCPLTPCSENFCEEETFFVDYPQIIFNKRKEFPVLIDASNKSILYDVKIDITNDETRLSKIYDENEKKWKSTYYYINSVNLSNKVFILMIDSDYFGNAIMEIKIKNFITFLYPIKIIDFFLNSSSQQNQTNQSNESYIKIVEFKKDEDTVKVKIKVYRGDTRKYAVYAYILDKEKGKKISEETIFYALDKFREYNLVLPIDLKNVKESKNYSLVLEGLDLKEEKEIFLEKSQEIFKCDEIEKSKEEIKKENEKVEEIDFGNFSLAYEIKSFDNKSFVVEGSLKNKGEPVNFYLWSYFEDCLSCEKSKEENVIIFFLNQNQTINFNLKNKILKEARGFYDLIINVLREGGEIKEIRESVFVDNTNSNIKNKCNDSIESKKENKNFFIALIFFFSFLIFLLLLILVFGKKLKIKKD